MRLTGKAFNQFNQYCIEQKILFLDDTHPSMKWGVYQDWADSIGYDVQIVVNMGQTRYGAEIYDKKSLYVADGTYETRQEARNAAIEKLNNLINEK